MRSITFLLLLTTSLFGQPTDIKVNNGQTNIYTDAILHYIDSAHNDNNLPFDTLFILKNEELTQNIMQNVINKTNISFQDSVNISERLKYHKSLKALNIFSNRNLGKDRINIIIVSFIISRNKEKNEYKPFENCTVRYTYDHNKKEFGFYQIVCDKY